MTSAKRFVRGLLLALVGVQPTPEGRAEDALAARPNVLMIAVDDLKPLLGCYGNDHVLSPHIDRLASHGTRFLNAHCQQAVCGPSRASLMTGLRPDTTRVYDLKTKMRSVLPDVVTLPQHFRSHGYTTAGVGKVFDHRCVDSRRLMDAPSWSRPFSSPGARANASFGYRNRSVIEKLRAGRSTAREAGKRGEKEVMRYLGLRLPTDAARVPDNEYTDGVIAEKAVELIDELTDSGSPFFLAVGFKKPHLPFNAPQRYWDLYDRDELPLAEFEGMPLEAPRLHFQDSWELRGGYSKIPAGRLPNDLQSKLVHGYCACVSYIDAQIGMLLDRLEASGAAENTIIVLWSDHGFHLGDHGMWCKHTSYEQATRVPLIVVAPNTSERANASGTPVELVDVFPTLCDLAGLPALAELEGVSLRPILGEPSASVKPAAISQYPRRSGNGRLMGYAFRDQRHRYVEWVPARTGRYEPAGQAAFRELYDYQSDPHETTNLIGDEATLARAGDLIAYADRHLRHASPISVGGE